MNGCSLVVKLPLVKSNPMQSIKYLEKLKSYNSYFRKIKITFFFFFTTYVGYLVSEFANEVYKNSRNFVQVTN